MAKEGSSIAHSSNTQFHMQWSEYEQARCSPVSLKFMPPAVQWASLEGPGYLEGWPTTLRCKCNRTKNLKRQTVQRGPRALHIKSGQDMSIANEFIAKQRMKLPLSFGFSQVTYHLRKLLEAL